MMHDYHWLDHVCHTCKIDLRILVLISSLKCIVERMVNDIEALQSHYLEEILPGPVAYPCVSCIGDNPCYRQVISK